MTLPVFKSAGAGAGYGGNNSVLAKPAGVVSGDLLIAHIVLGGFTASFSSLVPAGWTLGPADTVGAGAFSACAAVMYKIAGGSEPSTYPFDMGPNGGVGAIDAYSGVNPTTPFSITAMQDNPASSLNIPIPSVTTPVGDCLMLAFYSHRTSSTVSYTAPSDMTARLNYTGVAVAPSFGVAELALASAGATGTKTAASNKANPSFVIVLALTPAVAPTATAPGAPTIGAATAGVTSASVVCTAPASNGGAAISSYLFTASTGETSSSATTTGAFSTLSAGVARTFHAQAINSAGTGPASAESNSVTPTASNTAPIFSGTIANITGTGGTAIAPVNVSGLFSDTSGDTRVYSTSPGGTGWPSGLVVNASTGIISGTVATSTTAGLKVRATDAGGLSVDSNAFSVTIAAPSSTVTGVTVTPATLSAAGGSTGTLAATVAGTGSPSQAVNWSINAGSINSAGAYSLPATTGSIQTVTATATSAQDGTKSGTCVFTIAAAAAGYFVTEAWVSNADTVRANQAVVWEWHRLARIGSAGASVTYGAGTLSAGGTLTAGPIPSGAGYLVGAVPGADATTDKPFYQAGTVA